MLKVMTIVGTRPEIIRLSRVIATLDRYFSHVLVHTGQSYDFELSDIMFEQLEIRAPDHHLSASADSAGETIGRIIALFDKLLQERPPDAVLVLGDTNSSLAAIAAKRRQIPTFHMEAGNRCFDMRVPEEINRRIVDHVADVNLTYTQIARDYLLREGLPPDRVIVTGSPMREVLSYYGQRINSSSILTHLGLQADRFFLVSVHRQENVDDTARLNRVVDVLRSLARDFQLPVIVSTHPRTRARLEQLGVPTEDSLIQFLKPFGFLDYVNLQCHARAVLSDSGTITEESSILNFPALNLRDVHERPEGFEEGAVMLVGLSYERIRQGLEILVAQPRGSDRLLHVVKDYLADNVSEKVARIILSYTDYTHRVVWHRHP